MYKNVKHIKNVIMSEWKEYKNVKNGKWKNGQSNNM